MDNLILMMSPLLSSKLLLVLFFLRLLRPPVDPDDFLFLLKLDIILPICSIFIIISLIFFNNSELLFLNLPPQMGFVDFFINFLYLNKMHINWGPGVPGEGFPWDPGVGCP